MANNFLFGTPERTQQFQLKTPQQQGLQNQAIGGAGNVLQQLLGNKFDFNPIEQQARTGFETKTVPSLANRFQSMFGDSGARSSSFLPALSSAGSEFEQGLASLKSQYGLQQQGQQQNLLNMLLGQSSQPSFENLFRPREAGFLENTANKFTDYLPTILGALFGMPLPPAGGGQQQQQGGGLYALGGGFGQGNRMGGYNSNQGFGGQNFAQMFGQGY